jgi:YD repeat-containing protein
VERCIVHETAQQGVARLGISFIEELTMFRVVVRLGAFFTFLFTLAFIGYPASAQTYPVNPALDTGIKPFESYDGAQEAVNLASGNLSVTLPLVSLPGRNGHDLNLSISYNSQHWTPMQVDQLEGSAVQAQLSWSFEQTGVTLSDGAWQWNYPVLYASMAIMPGYSTCLEGAESYCTAYCYSNFTLVTGTGAKYSFGYSRNPNNNNSAVSGPYMLVDCWAAENGGTINNYIAAQSSLLQLCYEIPPNGQQFPVSEAILSLGSIISENDFIGSFRAPNIDQPIGMDSGDAQGGGFGGHVSLDMNRGVATLADGTQIWFPLSNFQGNPGGVNVMTAASYEVDPNGNVITWGNTTDTLGRSIAVSDSQISYRDSNGTPRTITLNYDTNTNPPVATFSQPTTASGFGLVNPTAGVEGMLSSVVLADGLRYTFQYNEFGELTKITYPSGGYTRYAYQAFEQPYTWSATDYNAFMVASAVADFREVVGKYVCPAAVGPPTQSGVIAGASTNTCTVAEDVTTYTPTFFAVGVPFTPVNEMNTVVDPLNNKTVHQFHITTYGNSNALGFLSQAPLEVNTSIYQGTAQLLETVSTSYAGLLPSSRTTTLANGLQSQVQWDHDFSVTTYNWQATETYICQTESSYCENGGTVAASIPVFANVETDNVIEQREYGYGHGAPGPLMRKTDYTWLKTNPINSVDYRQPPVHILNRKRSETVYDGVGNQTAQTTYEYDNYEGGISASGAVQHGIASNQYISANPYNTTYTTRGNVTAVNRWVNTSGAMLTTRNYQFDDAGNVLVQKDPLLNTTTFSYSDSWATGGSGGGAACSPANQSPPLSGNAAAFITTVTNAANQNSTYAWNSCSSTLASATDPNTKTTNFSYDAMNRRVRASYPDTGWTCLQYSDASNASCPSISASGLPINIVTTKAINASQNETSTTVLDGLSRVVQTQLNSDPYGTDYTDTAYDAVGDVASVSNPYRATDSTHGITYFQYDAMRRKVMQTQPDKFTLAWCYDGIAASGQKICLPNQSGANQLDSWVDSKDENGNHWQRVSDGLGRLVSVLEPNGTSASPSMETDYGYDVLNNLRSVDQWGGAVGTAGARGRSFNYDSLSRLLAATNPETGTITYNYLNSSGSLCAGDVSLPCSKTDARGVATKYAYDELNRVLSKSYSNDGNSTPWSCYQYDLSSVTNGTGRLSNAWTQSASVGTCAPTAPPTGYWTMRSIKAYDPMGRLNNEFQFTPANQLSGYNPQYTYDLAGNLITSTDGATPSPTSPGTKLTFTNAFDNAGRLQTLTSNASNSTNYPGTLFSAQAGLTPCSSSATAPYTAFGGLQNATFGNSLTLNRTYDLRLRTICETDTGSIVASPTNGSATVTITGSEQIQ